MPSCDVLILGSGFSGSLLAWVLASQGRRVVLVDRQRHPRFAIGESSTPTADFLLAYLAERWGLAALAPLASWGSWKQTYPEVDCGKKRGFSYYRHFPGRPFQDDASHTNSLLVAASAEDRWSDTHWLRSSVDQFLARSAVSAGVDLREEQQVMAAAYDLHARRWDVSLGAVSDNSVSAEPQEKVQATWVVDATGPANALSHWVANEADDHWMRTRTRATFGHFMGVKPFTVGWAEGDPFCGDDAAQHHLLDQGWCWMLRMDNGITSVGFVEPLPKREEVAHVEREKQRDKHREKNIWPETPSAGVSDPDSWSNQLAWHAYPSLAHLVAEASCVTPSGGWMRTGRLSRCRSRASGPGWVLLPVSYGFVDPLHSTGIAHALSGVVRVAEALLDEPDRCAERLKRYEVELRQEVDWLDLLVAGCYAGQPSFARFCAFACFYFVAAIAFEKQLAADPQSWPLGFLQCADPALRNVTEQAWQLQRQMEPGDDPATDMAFTESVRQALKPWNRVQLLDPQSANRIAHSAAPKYASWKSQQRATL